MSITHHTRLLDLIEKSSRQKTILFSAVAGFLVLELFICLAAVNYAGNKSWIVMTDPTGRVIYETPGQVLSAYDRQSFENTFGSIQNYQVTVRMETRPFPFRAWMAAAVGIPVGLILLVSFLIRVYQVLMLGEPGSGGSDRVDPTGSGSAPLRMFAFLESVQRFSVFSIGFLVILGVLVLWLVPGAMREIAVSGIGLVREFKWFFFSAALALLGMAVWIVFLRYRLSRIQLENQLILEKLRIEKQLPSPGKTEFPVLPPGSTQQVPTPRTVSSH